MSTPDNARLGVVSERGGIACHRVDGVLPIAYETLRKDPQTWSQAVAFCLPRELATRSRRNTISELGPDHNALQPEHREHTLFDLGLGVDFADFCVRSDDPVLIKALQNACGTALLEPGNPIAPLIVEAAPHRVFETNLARIEVYQPIGIEKSPEGPHTHILPKLISTGRAFSANTPIVNGYLPALTLHPANPCVDPLGQRKPFDAMAHERFQSQLKHWAVDEYWQQKKTTLAGLFEGLNCHDFNPGHSRLARTATRIAIRHHAHLYPNQDLRDWRQAFDIDDGEIVGDDNDN